MPIDILMPALSPTMEKGNLIRWVKAIGDRLRSDDVVAEVETDKATVEVAAGADGILAQILVPNGTQEVPVLQVIGLISAESEAKVLTHAEQALSYELSSISKEFVGPSPTAEMRAAPPSANGADMSRVFASPIARRLMAEAGLDVASVKGTGPRGRIVSAM